MIMSSWLVFCVQKFEAFHFQYAKELSGVPFTFPSFAKKSTRLKSRLFREVLVLFGQ